MSNFSRACMSELPDGHGYRQIFTFSPCTDKGVALVLGCLSLAICVVMLLLADFVLSLRMGNHFMASFDDNIIGAILLYFALVAAIMPPSTPIWLWVILSFAILIGLLIVVELLLELLQTHMRGAFMKHYGASRVACGLSRMRALMGTYGFIDCDDYFSKQAYITILLMPTVIICAVLTMLYLLVSSTWPLLIYLLLIAYLSSAVDGFYLTYKLAKMPSDILVKSENTTTNVYAPQHAE